MKKNNKKNITTQEFDEIFDEGKEDILQYCDVENTIKRVNVDFPSWVIESLDEEAKRVGITRQSIIKSWVISIIDEKQKTALEKKKLDLQLKLAP
ncbi:MAG: CopG family transcriptional regulator [Bdellovibrionota bacterium]